MYDVGTEITQRRAAAEKLGNNADYGKYSLMLSAYNKAKKDVSVYQKRIEQLVAGGMNKDSLVIRELRKKYLENSKKVTEHFNNYLK
jgi:hypothetical protein